MASEKKKNMFNYLGKVILIALLIVFVIRCFLIEPYTISSPQMETSLHEDEKVIVDKTAYGIRMPITILSIPFTFDHLFGLKTYSSAIQLPYKRIFSSRITRNDVVLFNNPMESTKPLDKSSLIASRCVGLPSDTIEMRDGVCWVGSTMYVKSPHFIDEYAFDTSDVKQLMGILDENAIPVRNLKNVIGNFSLGLSKYEAYLVNTNLPDSSMLTPIVSEYANYKFVIPSSAEKMILTASNVKIYGSIILKELGTSGLILKDKLLIDGEVQDTYVFQDDYYWMLSDNSINSIDSRSIGFVPFKSVIGKTRYIWFSSHNGGLNLDRCFTCVK